MESTESSLGNVSLETEETVDELEEEAQAEAKALQEEEQKSIGQEDLTAKEKAKVLVDGENARPLSYVAALRLRRRSGIWDYWYGKQGGVGVS